MAYSYPAKKMCALLKHLSGSQKLVLNGLSKEKGWMDPWSGQAFHLSN